MRWITVIFCCLVALILQSALMPRLDLWGVRADLLIALVLFFALFAKPGDAFVIAWATGFTADLLSLERLGFLALSYSVCALLVISVREFLFCYRPATQFAVTLVVSLILRSCWIGYRSVMYPETASLAEMVGMDVVLGSVYTAALTPVVHGVLLRCRGMFGIAKPRYSHAGMPKVAHHHV